jgi:hypothetical protein
MPPWGQFGKLDEVTPAFDVRTIGKVFCTMTTGQLRVPMRHDYDVNRLHRLSAVFQLGRCGRLIASSECAFTTELRRRLVQPARFCQGLTRP